MRRVLLPAILLVAFVYVRCARVSPPRDAVAEDMPHADHVLAVADPPGSLEELERRIAEILEAEGVPGAVVGLVGRDRPQWIGGVGVRDRATQAPMQPDTVFRVGSLSKSIVALAVMRLADQGALDVDAPLRELLPGLVTNPWEAVAPVTLAQCLEHTAGLDDIRFSEIFAGDDWLPVADALARNPRSRVVRWRPGTRHGYSNVGYTIAARAVEVASGEPFDTYVRREILTPLGMRDAAFGRTGELAARLAIGYRDGRAQAFHPFAHRPAGALLISASDLVKLVHFWIRRGAGYPPIVSEASLARIERSGTLPYPHLDNEYGFANYADVAHPTLSHGHDGGMPGFHASYRYFSDLGVGYVLLLNANYTFRGYFAIRSLLYAYLTRGSTQPSGRAAAPRDARERPGAGFFGLANPRHDVFAFIDNAVVGWRIVETSTGLLGRGLDGHRFSLEPTADGGYRFAEECGSSVRFVTDEHGAPVMLMSFAYAEGGAYWLAQLRYWALSLAVLLLTISPLWAAGHLGWAALRRRRTLPLSLVLPPALAGLAFFGAPHLLFGAFDAGVIGEVHPLTIALCAATLLFALASTMTLAATLRWALHPQRPRARALVMPALFGVAFFALTVWAGANGVIGFRTWAY